MQAEYVTRLSSDHVLHVYKWNERLYLENSRDKKKKKTTGNTAMNEEFPGIPH